MADPISQFKITNLHVLGTVGGHEIAITNSTLFMGLAVVGVTALMLGATASRSLVPGRLQSIAELSYEFVADMIKSTAGPAGLRFFPLVFSLFMFILFLNLLGMFPLGGFTVTSHIIVTAGLALIVFFTVVIYGLWHNGLKFFKIFAPSGVPVYLLPLVSLVEVISFMSRPVSHSVRLFANMLAGHITLKVFAGFVVAMSALGIHGWVGSLLPLAMTTALVGLELLVAFLQAYVFAILTCVYLSDAVNAGHH